MLINLSEDQINQTIEILTEEKTVLIMDALAEIDNIQESDEQMQNIWKLTAIIDNLNNSKSSNVPANSGTTPEELADCLADLLGIDTVDPKTPSWPNIKKLYEMLHSIMKAESIGNTVILTMNNGSTYHLNICHHKSQNDPKSDYLWQWTSYI